MTCADPFDDGKIVLDNVRLFFTSSLSHLYQSLAIPGTNLQALLTKWDLSVKAYALADEEGRLIEFRALLLDACGLVDVC